MEENKKLKRGERPKDWKNYCPKFKEYYKFHNPEWNDEKCIMEAKKYNKSINWQCIEFYQKKYPHKSLEECEELRKKAISKKNKNHSFNIEYYRERYPEASEEELQKMLSDHAKSNNFQNIDEAISPKPYPIFSDNLTIITTFYYWKENRISLDTRLSNTNHKIKP